MRFAAIFVGRDFFRRSVALHSSAVVTEHCEPRIFNWTVSVVQDALDFFNERERDAALFKVVMEKLSASEASSVFLMDGFVTVCWWSPAVSKQSTSQPQSNDVITGQTEFFHSSRGIRCAVINDVRRVGGWGRGRH